MVVAVEVIEGVVMKYYCLDYYYIVSYRSTICSSIGGSRTSISSEGLKSTVFCGGCSSFCYFSSTTFSTFRYCGGGASSFDSSRSNGSARCCVMTVVLIFIAVEVKYQ